MARVAPESTSVMDEAIRSEQQAAQGARSDKRAGRAGRTSAGHPDRASGKVLVKTQRRHAGPYGASFDGRREDGRPARA